MPVSMWPISMTNLVRAQRTDRHVLAGTVTVDGAPSERRIHVHDRKTMQVLAVTRSDATTGKWKIYGIPEYEERSLIVFSLDDAGAHNAEVADFISQVTGN